MRRLVARVYLLVIKVVYRALRGAGCSWDFKELEHLATEFWSGGARGCANKYALVLEL